MRKLSRATKIGEDIGCDQIVVKQIANVISVLPDLEA